MAEYPINKGIGRPVEFKGLKAQYLFIFAGGLLAAFVLFVILYMAGAGQWLCIGFGVVFASATVWLTFRLNAKYGEHGLMKLGAARMRPRHVLHRRRVSNLLRRKKRKEETYEKCNESHHAGKPLPAALGGARLHRLEGRGHYRRLRGGTAGGSIP